MPVIESGPLKTGQRPVLKQEKTYKAGEDLFVEGEKGNELFIIQEGEVAVLKKLEEGTLQLAKLPAGTIVGEMALLDDMPRSATIRALKPTKVTVINRLAFNAILEKVPLWLRSIVKIVSSRLRDANTRVGTSLLRDHECGVAGLITLMAPRHGHPAGENMILSYNLAKNLTMFTSRMLAKHFTAALEALVRRGLVTVEKDTQGHANVCVKDLGALRLFVEYRKLKAQGRAVVGVGLDDKAHEFLSNMAYVSQKQGHQTPAGYFLPFSAIDFGEEKENRRLLGELEKKRVLETVLPEGDQEEGIVYDRNVLAKVKKLKVWIQNFEMVVTPGTGA
ncbi:MAG: Crp/Fnr family transcriptional regulator [Fibrobacterota bacterium]